MQVGIILILDSVCENKYKICPVASVSAHAPVSSIEIVNWNTQVCSEIIVPRRDSCDSLRGFANNNGADQPAHPRRLISAFVIRLLESISKIAESEI